jgi:Cu2+-exporting ATPase
LEATNTLENAIAAPAMSGLSRPAAASGSLRLMTREGVELGPLASTDDRLTAGGRTVVAVAVDGRAVGLLALADFAVVQSYLSTAATWGIDHLDALTGLFITGPWRPDAIRPG